MSGKKNGRFPVGIRTTSPPALAPLTVESKNSTHIYIYFNGVRLAEPLNILHYIVRIYIYIVCT